MSTHVGSASDVKKNFRTLNGSTGNTDTQKYHFTIKNTMVHLKLLISWRIYTIAISFNSKVSSFYPRLLSFISEVSSTS